MHYNQIVNKLQELPSPQLNEVNDFIEFLMLKQNDTLWQMWTHFRESLEIMELDFTDYLTNLQTYEELLAKGKIKW